jgi:hypothetical protein
MPPQETVELEIELVATFNGMPLKKNKWYVTKKSDSIQLTSLKFYLTNFKLSTPTLVASESEMNLLIDGFKKKVFKLNFLVDKITKNDRLICDLGVNQAHNTSGANAGDLDPVNGMFWSWQSGYINFKIEGVSPSCMTRKNKFQFHIGGYQNPHNTLRNFTINLNKQNLELNLNLEKFFEFTKLSNENQVLIPGSNADQLATVFYNAFSVF